MDRPKTGARGKQMGVSTAAPACLSQSARVVRTVLFFFPKKKSGSAGSGLMKNPEEEDQPRKICIRCFVGGPLLPGS